MAAVAGTSSGASTSGVINMEILFSFEDMVQILYIVGLTRIVIWEQVFDNVKRFIFDQSDSAVVNAFMILRSALLSIVEGLNAQEPFQHKITLRESNLPLNKMVDYFSEVMGENFTVKAMGYNCAKALKDLVKKSYQLFLNEMDFVKNESDDEEDSTSDDDDECEKDFNSIMKSKKSSSSTTCEQSFHIIDNGMRESITTPGEKGSHLIKIEVTDFADIKNVPVDERWKFVAKKAIFLVKSSSDPIYKDLNTILKSAFENLKSIKGLKKSESKVTSSIRFKPY